MLGKAKCFLLREIRKEIAESNRIVYLTKECSCTGNCSGTCDITDAETRYLEAELKRMVMANEDISLAQIRLEKFSSVNDFAALDLWSYMKKTIIVTEEDIYSLTIAEANQSVRTVNCLKRVGIFTVRDLVSITDSQLAAVPNLGRKSYEEVHQMLRTFGLFLKRESSDIDDL